MKRAALYARVSTDTQKDEKTIASQIYELKQHVERDGNTLVKEYADDGWSGARLDRPALDTLRADLKENLFDVIYFYAVDRIARDVAYQLIIVSEILKNDKQIIINGRDYVENPENKFTLTVLGAVAELEKAKIIERTTRGKRHKVRQGFIPGGGGTTPFGYTYVKKCDNVPAHFVINETEAETVRYLFNEYANTETSLDALVRRLEERGIKTQSGRTLWQRSSIHRLLQNSAYHGIQYYYKLKNVFVDDPRKGKIRKTFIRDVAEWIPVNIPAIIPQELFARAQEKLERNRQVYRNTAQFKYLLSGLVTCEQCRKSYVGFGRPYKYHDPTLKYRFYRCGGNLKKRTHTKSLQPTRCSNKEISASRIENGIWLTIVNEVLNPAALKTHVEVLRTRTRNRVYEEKLRIIDKELKSFEEQKQRVLDLYAEGHASKDHYFRKLESLEKEQQKLLEKRAEIIKTMPLVEDPKLVRKSVDAYCARLNEQVSRIHDFEAKRQFLCEVIESVSFENDALKIRGFVPITSGAPAQNRAGAGNYAMSCTRSDGHCRKHLVVRQQRQPRLVPRHHEHLGL